MRLSVLKLYCSIGIISAIHEETEGIKRLSSHKSIK